MMSDRDYDLILLGATGYTGKLCAQHIATHLPTTLRWAVAGRTATKLQSIVNNIRELNTDRIQPHVLQVELNKPELDELAKKTAVLINCVGPYHIYATPVIEACANSGTHYLDATGETIWVREILRFHSTAQTNHAILIPEIGFESAPSDLAAYSAVSELRKAYNCGASEVTCSIHEIKSAGFSGGTLATVMGIFDNYPSSAVRASFDPFSLSPLPKSQRPQPPRRSLLSRALGTFNHPDLGILTTSISAPANVAIVHRSAGLMPDFYGPNFYFSEYMRVPNYIRGIAFHLGVILAGLLLSLRPFRAIVKKLIYLPGEGPSLENDSSDMGEQRVVAEADLPAEPQGTAPKKAMGRFRFQGGVYNLTGVLLAEAAMVLLKEKELVAKLGGGVLTPACLGEKFIERLDKVGVHVSAELLRD